MTDNPLIGELNPALGHGTFIAGIVRQVAPEARVLAVRVMHSDDVLYEGDIICALRHLATRIALARRSTRRHSRRRLAVVRLLQRVRGRPGADLRALAGDRGAARLGVVVVAAAGNYATSRKFYPAAFARSRSADQVPVISVGALNPNGTKAVFSNDGHWVTAWAVGACVVSTYPMTPTPAALPSSGFPPTGCHPDSGRPAARRSIPNDYSGGFALWSGTSFSAPYVAALIARSLLKGASLSDPG